MTRQFANHTLDSLRWRCDEIGRCWIWTGATDGHGKPSMRYRGKVVNPRRVARELQDGEPVGPGVQVVPTCGNHLCISPECSKKTDQKGRAQLASKRGAFSNPAKNRRAALTKRATSWITDELVSKIRAARTGAHASELTGVSLSHCKAIRSGSARKDYGNPFIGIAASNSSTQRRAA